MQTVSFIILGLLLATSVFASRLPEEGPDSRSHTRWGSSGWGSSGISGGFVAAFPFSCNCLSTCVSTVITWLLDIYDQTFILRYWYVTIMSNYNFLGITIIVLLQIVMNEPISELFLIIKFFQNFKPIFPVHRWLYLCYCLQLLRIQHQLWGCDRALWIVCH